MARDRGVHFTHRSPVGADTGLRALQPSGVLTRPAWRGFPTGRLCRCSSTRARKTPWIAFLPHQAGSRRSGDRRPLRPGLALRSDCRREFGARSYSCQRHQRHQRRLPFAGPRRRHEPPLFIAPASTVESARASMSNSAAQMSYVTFCPNSFWSRDRGRDTCPSGSRSSCRSSSP